MGGSLPSSGGINRGRGDAELTFGPDPGELDGAFEAQRLNPSEFKSLEDSALLGVSEAAPEASGVGGQSSGRRDLEASAGASTFKRRLVPRHRRAVSAFFRGKEPR